MDNSATQTLLDNPEPTTESFSAVTAGSGKPVPETSTDAGSVASSWSWKTNLRPDLRDSALLQKFDDSPEGLTKAVESHASLEKLLGHEKVPIPKGPEDVEGWNRFSKALGIPDKAEGYGLSDAQIPDSMKGMTLDKNKFAEVVHAHKLTPAQAKGLWQAYQQINVDSYTKAMEAHKANMTKVVNGLKGEWGDAYNTNIELGQMVINKFSDDKEMNDFITNSLAQDPRGIKFLKKIGEQFAESKVGEFQIKRFSMEPEAAMNEIKKIKADPSHPYNNPKSTDAEHNAAVDYVNSLFAVVNRAKG